MSYHQRFRDRYVNPVRGVPYFVPLAKASTSRSYSLARVPQRPLSSCRIQPPSYSAGATRTICFVLYRVEKREAAQPHEKIRRRSHGPQLSHTTRKVSLDYSEATHLFVENDLCKPLFSRIVNPRPFGPVKLLIFTPITRRSTLRFPFLGYRKSTPRPLRLRQRSFIIGKPFDLRKRKLLNAF